jgi:8-oxo-dGTP pyrophosphatase MutT (NUDIX family)
VPEIGVDLHLWEEVEAAIEMTMDQRDVVRAAGGVVYRYTDEGEVEVALIHRPAYDDWSLPKGKLKPGERLEEAALREVEEETGLKCMIARSLGIIEYVDRRGREKVVWYWLMRSIGGAFVPGDEVDRMRWLKVEDAGEKLSYDHDQELLRRADLVT